MVENPDSVTLKLEELERVFEMFHPTPQDFKDCQISDYSLSLAPTMAYSRFNS